MKRDWLHEHAFVHLAMLWQQELSLLVNDGGPTIFYHFRFQCTILQRQPGEEYRRVEDPVNAAKVSKDVARPGAWQDNQASLADSMC